MTALQRVFFTGSALEAQLYPRLERRIRFRPYTLADNDACLEIYRRNEAGRFPPTHRPKLERYLQAQEKTFVVAECDGRVVATGGLTCSSPHSATLCYGLVDPEYQGQRIGTTLTLLRIAQIPPVAPGVALSIFAVHTSMPFFRRFGFLERGTWQEEGSPEYPFASVFVGSQSLRYIRLVLDKRGIQVEGKLVLYDSPDTRGRVEEVRPGWYRFEL